MKAHQLLGKSHGFRASVLGARDKGSPTIYYMTPQRSSHNPSDSLNTRRGEIQALNTPLPETDSVDTYTGGKARFCTAWSLCNVVGLRGIFMKKTKTLWMQTRHAGRGPSKAGAQESCVNFPVNLLLLVHMGNSTTKWFIAATFIIARDWKKCPLRRKS